jgi:hypothetical protein
VTDDPSAIPSEPEPDEPDDTAGTGIDTTVPHSARIWNYWLGGTDNYDVDRAAGDQYTPGPSWAGFIFECGRTGRRRWIIRRPRTGTGRAADSGAGGQDPREPAMTPQDLLTEARRLVEHPDAATTGVWPRAAALLARQALEQAMAGLWATQASGLSDSTMRSQLLCLTAYVDEDVTTRATYLSAALSRGCHHHPYELAPTATELVRWLNETADLVALLPSRAA